MATADVFIANYPPELSAKLQVNYEEFARLNPRPISDHANGSDALWIGRPFGLARLVRFDHLALYQRQMIGCGAKVTTSLMAAGAWSNSCQVQAAMVGATFPVRRPRLKALNPLVNQYQTRDGQRFMFCCLDTANGWGRICRAIGRVELTDAQRYSSAEARSERSEEVVALLDEAIGGRDMAEWDVLFRKEGVVWGPIPTMDHVAADPQMKANGVFAELDHPQLGRILTISSPLNVQGVVKEKPTAAPEVGERSREILRSLGYTDEEIAEFFWQGRGEF